MAQSLDQKAAIRYAPEDLKKFIAATVKGYKFKLFLEQIIGIKNQRVNGLFQFQQLILFLWPKN